MLAKVVFRMGKLRKNNVNQYEIIYEELELNLS